MFYNCCFWRRRARITIRGSQLQNIHHRPIVKSDAVYYCNYWGSGFQKSSTH